jgi:hypothetical protein
MILAKALHAEAILMDDDVLQAAQIGRVYRKAT